MRGGRGRIIGDFTSCATDDSTGTGTGTGTGTARHGGLVGAARLHRAPTTFTHNSHTENRPTANRFDGAALKHSRHVDRKMFKMRELRGAGVVTVRHVPGETDQPSRPVHEAGTSSATVRQS